MLIMELRELLGSCGITELKIKKVKEDYFFVVPQHNALSAWAHSWSYRQIEIQHIFITKSCSYKFLHITRVSTWYCRRILPLQHENVIIHTACMEDLPSKYFLRCFVLQSLYSVLCLIGKFSHYKWNVYVEPYPGMIQHHFVILWFKSFSRNFMTT